MTIEAKRRQQQEMEELITRLDTDPELKFRKSAKLRNMERQVESLGQIGNIDEPRMYRDAKDKKKECQKLKKEETAKHKKVREKKV